MSVENPFTVNVVKVITNFSSKMLRTAFLYQEYFTPNIKPVALSSSTVINCTNCVLYVHHYANNVRNFAKHSGIESLKFVEVG